MSSRSIRRWGMPAKSSETLWWSRRRRFAARRFAGRKESKARSRPAPHGGGGREDRPRRTTSRPSAARGAYGSAHARVHGEYDFLVTPALADARPSMSASCSPLDDDGSAWMAMDAVQLPLQPDAAAGRERAVRLHQRRVAGGPADRRRYRRCRQRGRARL